MRDNKGSLTVEASITVPVFLFAMLAIIYMCNALAVKGIIYEASVETSEYMAEYAYLSDRFETAELASPVMAAAKFRDYLDDTELVDRFVTGGSMGITFLGSSFPDSEGNIRLRVTYRLGINAPMFGSFSKLCSFEIRQKAYLGYDLKNIEEKDDEDDVYVYLADNSAVYHLSRSCTYIHYDIDTVSKDVAVKDHRKKCEYCGRNSGDTVFVTEYGDRYHSTKSCSRLARNVRRVKKSEVEGSYPPCSKCGGSH